MTHKWGLQDERQAWRLATGSGATSRRRLCDELDHGENAFELSGHVLELKGSDRKLLGSSSGVPVQRLRAGKRGFGSLE